MHKRLTGILFFLVGIVILLPIGTGFTATVEPPRNPNSAKGCAICHYRWIDTFFVEGRGTDLVPYQSEKVAATPEMCISCHDGSIMDSRKRMLHGKQHKTDVKPPADMQIPAIFPLDGNGNVTCATCHTAHGVESGPGVTETIFLRMSNIDSAMCRACHTDKAGGPDAGNHSLTAAKQPIPNVLKMNYAHEGSKKNQIICETCHTAHGSTSEGYLVKGAGDSGLCIACHTDKNIFDPSGQRNPNHVINVVPQKASIPEVLKNQGAKLGYSGILTCQTCHTVHNNPIKQPQLLVLDNDNSNFCLACHTDKQRVLKTKHNLAISAKSEKNLEGKTALQAGVCSACHLPHQPARRPFAEGKTTDRTTGLCMSCHAQERIAGNKNLTGYRHPVNVSLPARADAIPEGRHRSIEHEARFPALPLFNDLGVTDPKGKVTCTTCHDIHGGPVVQETPVEGNQASNEKNTLLRMTSPEICRQCHAEKFAIENSRHDFKRVFPDGNERMRQKAPRTDLCQNCHRIHSSQPDGFIWKQRITTAGGDPVVDMCTVCHAKGGLASEMTIGKNSHPVNMSFSGRPRPRTLPLFSATGKTTPAGIMTCFTCHDPHRGFPIQSPGGGQTTVEVGPPNHFLRIQAAPASDLCVNCHADKADVRQSDHNLLRTAPGVKNALGLTPNESGICGACHIVHNSTEKIDLWAMTPGSGDNVMERMCNSCHSKNGAAATKVPAVSSHPDTLFVSVWQSAKDNKPRFPFFDKRTGEISAVGNISCPSCHDVHHWAGSPVRIGAPSNLKGDATTSFLRPHVAERVCKQCHGPDGLFVFKYFHKAGIRKIK